MRTIPDIGVHLQAVDDIVSTDFIPTCIDGIICSPLERESLPTKLGDLNIPIFVDLAPIEFDNSTKISKSLKETILAQTPMLHEDNGKNSLKTKFRTEKIKRNESFKENKRTGIRSPKKPNRFEL